MESLIFFFAPLRKTEKLISFFLEINRVPFYVPFLGFLFPLP